MSQINTILLVLGRYGVSLAVVIGSILINPYLTTRFEASGLFIILAAILFSAWYGGLGPGLFTTSVGALGIAYHLMEPRGSIGINSADDVLRLLLFVLISLAVVFFTWSREIALSRLAEANKGLTRLTERLNIVREEEQARLARDLHDQLGGLLVLLKIYIVSVKRIVNNDNIIEDKTNAILNQLDEAIEMVQQTAMELRPSILDHAGLPAAIDAYLDAHCQRAELNCKKDIYPQVQLESACATALFRIFQAAFTNIIRHAKAKEVIVRLKQDGSNTTLSVCDNGIGLERGQILQPTGLGLIGMRERIRPFGGTVTFTGSPGQGTTVTVVVPGSGHS
jgi:signal transduction histidine kinase